MEKLTEDQIYQFKDYKDYLRINNRNYYRPQTLIAVLAMGGLLGLIFGFAIGLLF